MATVLLPGKMATVAKANAPGSFLAASLRAIVVGERKQETRVTTPIRRMKPSRVCLVQLEVNLGTLVDLSVCDCFLPIRPQDRRIQFDI